MNTVYDVPKTRLSLSTKFDFKPNQILWKIYTCNSCWAIAFITRERRSWFPCCRTNRKSKYDDDDFESRYNQQNENRRVGWASGPSICPHLISTIALAQIRSQLSLEPAQEMPRHVKRRNLGKIIWNARSLERVWWQRTNDVYTVQQLDKIRWRINTGLINAFASGLIWFHCSSDSLISTTLL